MKTLRTWHGKKCCLHTLHSAETFNNPDTLAMILEDNGHDLKIKLEKLRDETSVVRDGTGVIFKILPLPQRGLI